MMPPSTPPAPAFSPALLHEAAGGDDALVAELLSIFARTVPPMLGRLKAALAGGDAAYVAQEAHDLKGCLALVGAPDTSTACARIETAARRSGTCPTSADAAPLCERIEDIVKQVERYRATTSYP